MNSPKLTNVLLIILIAFNALFLMGWVASLMQRHTPRHEFAMRNQFRGRFHDSRSFRQCFGACRSSHGGYYGGFRNRHRGRMSQYYNVN